VNPKKSFPDLSCTDQMHMAERELAAFISAVTELFGPEQAKLSADDWLEEWELRYNPPRSTNRDWRGVTIAASARLANRLNVSRHQRAPKAASGDTQVSPIPSSNCFAPTFLM
jgi:hypothetical protein